MRKSLALLLVLALVGSTAASFLSVKANPNPYDLKEVTAPDSVKLTVKIASPKENTVYSNGTINLCFNVTLYGNQSILQSIQRTTYKGDWMEEPRMCPVLTESAPGQTVQLTQIDFNFTDIPFGEHTLEITPHVQGGYWENDNVTWAEFTLEKTFSVKFYVRTNPIITFLSPQNATFEDSSLPLNFTVEHPVTEMAYSLDGQESVPISGNSTLTGLSNGQHNVTVYTTDELGDSASGTINFTVAVPFPTLTVTAVSAVSAVAASAGLIVYFKKYRH